MIARVVRSGRSEGLYTGGGVVVEGGRATNGRPQRHLYK